jgi:hypothetical protein
MKCPGSTVPLYQQEGARSSICETSAPKATVGNERRSKLKKFSAESNGVDCCRRDYNAWIHRGQIPVSVRHYLQRYSRQQIPVAVQKNFGRKQWRS